jgi:general secretion pathway protein I
MRRRAGEKAVTGGTQRPTRRRGACVARGFTLVEVLVALMIVALGLTALMTTVSSAARTSGYLRDKALAQWIALNRLAEVRLHLQSTPGANGDTGELDFANRKWHYDTRYFDTSTPAMRRVIVRVWPGPADEKGNPLAETSGFLGTSIAAAGNSNTFYQTLGSGPSAPAANGAAGTNVTKPTTGAPASPGSPINNAPVLTPNTTTTTTATPTTANP